jgi:hypothetical protein
LNNAIKRLGYESGLTDEEVIFLNSIYRARYPSDLGLIPSGDPTELDAQKALIVAKTIVSWSIRIKNLVTQ